MPALTGGQALVRSLYREGVRVVFGVPGDGQYEAVDALFEEPRIRYVSVRHEQAASYMADGYARAGGGIAAILVVPGPGVLNAAAGMVTANAVSSPMLVVTGSRHFQRRGSGEEEGEFLRELSTWNKTAERPAQIPDLVRQAFRRMKTQRPGPTVLQISRSVLAESTDVEWAEVGEDSPPMAEAELIAAAAALLAGARRPLIWAGGGVIAADAAPLVQALAQRLNAPVVTTRSGKGAISDRHALSLGMAELRYRPLRRWLEGCDLILAVGTRTDLSSFEAQVVQIDIEPDHLDQGENVLGIAADARLALEALYAALDPFQPNRNDLVGEIEKLNADRFDPSAPASAPVGTDGGCARGYARRWYSGTGYEPDGLLQPQLLSGICAAHLSYGLIALHSWLYVPACLGRKVGASRPRRSCPLRRRRFSLQRPGTGDRRPLWHKCRCRRL